MIGPRNLRWQEIDVYREMLILFGRGLRLVCPVCGEGRLFYPWRFKMYERCQVCGFVYEREEGYFTGAMAVNLVIAELLMTIVVIPLSIQPWASLVVILLSGLAMSILLPCLFYRHSKGLWMSLDHILHPVEDM